MKILNDKEDFFNRNHTRNEGNTHYADYNCGGWALKTFSWFVPYRSASDRYDYLYCFYVAKVVIIKQIILIFYLNLAVDRLIL